MDTHSIITIVTMVVLVIFSGYFSATETAFSSLNKARLKNMALHGSKSAQHVLDLSEQYDKMLSTILVGNNIVNIALTAIATVFFVSLIGQETGATVSTVIVTVVVLIFGEITPKSLAMESPEKFAIISAPILRVFMFLLTPINWLFAKWKLFISKIFKVDEDRRVTEEELLTLVDEAATEGGIGAEDSELIHNVIGFNDREAFDIFTPRVDVQGVSIDAENKSIARIFAESEYSRLPVYRGDMDNIVGVLHEKDFYCYIYGTKKSISSVVQRVEFITPSMKIRELLKLLQKTKSHMAIIADEYGGTIGIVTMEDILEELVGEIWDEHDEVIEEFKKISENCFAVAGGVETIKFLRYFNIIDDESDSATISGWVMEQLGKIPQIEDSFVYQNLTVTVSQTDHKRVIEIVVKIEPKKDNEDDNGN